MHHHRDFPSTPTSLKLGGGGEGPVKFWKKAFELSKFGIVYTV